MRQINLIFLYIAIILVTSCASTSKQVPTPTNTVELDVFSSSVDQLLKNKDLYDIFIKNMKQSHVLDMLTIKKMKSTDASKEYDDYSIDFLYLDASHDYTSVKDDIHHWLPKIKLGGWITGDDYHPDWSGVIKAVDECFLGKADILKDQWRYKVTPL